MLGWVSTREVEPLLELYLSWKRPTLPSNQLLTPYTWRSVIQVGHLVVRAEFVDTITSILSSPAHTSEDITYREQRASNQIIHCYYYVHGMEFKNIMLKLLIPVWKNKIKFRTNDTSLVEVEKPLLPVYVCTPSRAPGVHITQVHDFKACNTQPSSH